MAERIAIKKLTASDCTLFEAVFRKIGAGNQKSINLNADVLTGQLYPNLSTAAAASNNEIALAISLYGPSGKPAHKLSRKIIKNATYKNWRLNGEFIYGPPSDPTRYDDIVPGDFAIMVFKGDVTPTGMDLIIVAQGSPEDAALHTALAALFGNKSMIAVSSGDIAAAAATANAPDGHPIYVAAADPEMDAALEDAAQGGEAGTTKLLKNKKGKKVSPAEFAKSKAKTELTGQDGEGLVNAYLASLLASGKINSYTWASSENAISPFDFEINEAGTKTLIDAKATGGDFTNPIHLSLAEIVEAAGETPYRIYRVFDLSENGGKLRISDDIRPLAQTLKDTHEKHIPKGVRVDSFSIAISALTWGPELYVERPDGEE
ncbi:hypothetical protein [Microvirga sp. G4-2]|uniref:hypothetical protein n=1 Tax=Microvirga sp. G4-2 TaxID=3434467 RepID=UPI00404494D3